MKPSIQTMLNRLKMTRIESIVGSASGNFVVISEIAAVKFLKDYILVILKSGEKVSLEYNDVAVEKFPQIFRETTL